MELTKEQQTKARSWANEHIDHIRRMLDAEDLICFPPSEEDASHPELWKSSSWGWYLTKYKNT